MAKRTVPPVEPEEVIIPEEEPTPEDYERWEREREEERARKLAPYRAVHTQQTEQDELIAEIMFQETMRELEG